MKRIMQIIFGFILTLTLVSCVSIQNPPTKSPTPDNLPLSYVLIKPEDVQGQWRWTNTYDEKSIITPLPDYKTPTPSPDGPINKAFTAFAGFSEGYYFSFAHMINEYSSKEDVPGLAQDDSFAEPFTLNLNGIGDSLNYECSQQPPDAPIQVFLCRISVQYDNIDSFLFVTGDPRIGQENIETMTTQILLTVEGRIKRYQSQ